MRFRTKLLITSLAIVLIPLILSVGTYLALGRYLVYQQHAQQYSTAVDYGMVSDPAGTFVEMTDELLEVGAASRNEYSNLDHDERKSVYP